MRLLTILALSLIAFGVVGVAWTTLRGQATAAQNAAIADAAESKRKTFDAPPGVDPQEYFMRITQSLGFFTYARQHPDRVVGCTYFPEDNLETVHRISQERLGETTLQESMLRLMLCQHAMGHNVEAEATGRRIIAELDAGEDDIEVRRAVLSVLYWRPFPARTQLWALHQLHDAQLAPNFAMKSIDTIDDRSVELLSEILEGQMRDEEREARQ